ncbi:MAG: hypothetical protein Q4G64_10895 [bacterium]|nr:hypothetical protein [bacterium]
MSRQFASPELFERSDPPHESGAPRALDPLGREVIPNEPLPRRPWWQLVIASLGMAASVVFMLMFAQSLLTNIAIEDIDGASFLNTGVALMGGLLSFALFIGYFRWFTRYGNLTGLVVLVLVTVLPPAMRYL